MLEILGGRGNLNCGDRNRNLGCLPHGLLIPTYKIFVSHGLAPGGSNRLGTPHQNLYTL